LDKKIVFMYGWYPKTHIFPLVPHLVELRKQYDFVLLLVIAREYVNEELLREIEEHDLIEWRDELPPLSRLDKYFHASDVHIWYKPRYEFKPGEIMVSSSVLSYLGTLTLFEGKPIVNETLSLAEEYVSQNSAEKIAQEYMKLIEGLMSTSGN